MDKARREERAKLYAYGTKHPPIENRNQFDDERMGCFADGFSVGYADAEQRVRILREALEIYAKCDGFCATDECICNTRHANEALNAVQP